MRYLVFPSASPGPLGQSLAETKAAVDLSNYQDWGQFKAWSQLNIKVAHQRIQ